MFLPAQVKNFLKKTKKEIKNIKSPEFLRPIAGEYLFKREPKKVMTFRVGEGMTPEEKEKARKVIEKYTKKAPPEPTIFTATLPEVMKSGFEREKERKKEQEIFRKKYPERYAEIQRIKTSFVVPGMAERLVKKGKLTPYEAELFRVPEVWPDIGAIKFVSLKNMTPELAREILKVGKKATKEEILSAFRKAIHKPEIKKILRGLSKESGAKEMDILTRARDVLLKKIKPEIIKPLHLPKTGEVEPKKIISKELKPYIEQAKIVKDVDEFKDILVSQGKAEEFTDLLKKAKIKDLGEFWNKIRPEKSVKITPEVPELPSEAVSKVRGIKPLPKAKKPVEAKIEGISKEIHKSDKELIEILTKKLKEAPLFRGKQEKLYTEARAKKLAELLRIRGKEKGEERFYKELAALKGELPKLQFQPIREGFDQKSVDRLFDMIAKNRVLGDWEKISAQKGLLKVLEGRIPTKGEISLLNDVFGEKFTKALLEKRPFFEKLIDMGMQLYNLSRSFLAGFFDFSATYMQNLLFAHRHPIRTSKNFVKSLKMFVSETFFKESMEEIVMRPTYKAMKKAKLPLTEMGGIITEREEMFMAPIAEKIPGIGRIIRATGRAYTGFLNRMRADIFDAYYKSAKLAGVDVTDEKFLKSLGRAIGNATGRGKLPGQLEKAMPVLSQGLFSARKLAATFDMINPEFYITLHPYVRRKVLEIWLAFLGGGLTLLTIGKLAGAEVETEPTNADFGKIKIGNTRINVFGSFQSIAVLLARLWKGYITSSTTRKRMVLGEGYKPTTRLDIISRFFSMKQHPTLTFIISLLRGTDQIGRKFDWKKDALKMYIPMVFQDAYDLFKEHGATGLPFFGITLAMLGVPVQTYTPTIRFNEKITKEVRRLQDKGYSEIVGIGAYMPGYPSLSLKENDVMQRYAEKLANYKISDLLVSREYKKLSDEEKARKINNEVRKAIRQAKVKMILEKIKELKGEELRRQLKKFRDDGLLTKTIFEEIKKEREIKF